MSENLAALKKQRSTNKGKLTNLVKYAEQDHTKTDLGELTTRLRRVEALMQEFTDLETRIFAVDIKEESDSSYEENYYTAVTSFNKWIRAKSLNQGVVSLDVSHNETYTGEHNQIKLPKIHIPSFAGDYSEWQSFFDLFTSTIHESPNLNPVQKFQYLKGLLRGEAAVLLRHIAVTEGNYIGALNKLKERYNRKKQIINNFIRTFVEQPVIHSPNVNTIKRLMDTSDEVVRGLHALGEIAETRDHWLIYILRQKLDDKSKALWAEHSAEMDNPELSDFFKFLGRRIDTLESIQGTSRRANSKLEVKSHVSSNGYDERVEGHTAIKSIVKFQCAMCKDPEHSLFHCNQFQSLDTKGRIEFIKKNNRCINCLGNNHPIFRCLSRRRCQKCGKKHNTLLHQTENSEELQAKSPSTSSDQVTNMHIQNRTTCSILPTAIIDAIDDSGKTISCRALLDSGSQASFVTESCVQRLRLKRQNSRIPISGLGLSGCGISRGLVLINIKPESLPEFTVEALVMPKITNVLPSRRLSVDLTSYTKLKLADPQFDTPSSIDVLIGADHFFNIIRNGQIKGSPNEPILQNTIFGWVVSGQINNSSDHQLALFQTSSTKETEMVNIDQSLRKFWELESVNPRDKMLSPEEAFCEDHFITNLKRSAQGRFTVKLPFKKSPADLGESLPLAIQRLRAMERRFIRDPCFAKLYHEFMDEYQRLNHMVEIPPNRESGNGFYLPHHGVLKASGTTSKIRVVFDGSAKSSSGLSLNDCLAIGPTVQSSLYAVILRFRERKIAFSADVEKMYRQIDVSPEDTSYQKIVWRSNPSDPIRHFSLSTVTYGLTSASFLATRALQQIAKENENSSPAAAHVINKDIYVDDVMTGADNENAAMQLKSQVTETLKGYGFCLKKWKSSSNQILSTIPHEHRDVNLKDIHDQTQPHDDSVKVLGIKWNPDSDIFMFTSHLPDATSFTKRTVLSEASKLFDPLGWLSPVVITFKIFIQMLWADNLGWDDPLPHDKGVIWSKIRSNLKIISSISIPRFVRSYQGSIIDIHGFCDASQSAYAAVIFLRTTNADGKIHISLISSKTRVAPIKQQSLPRLELCAALLLANLVETIKGESSFKMNQTYLWTDSQIVLDWLSSHPRRWSTFVGNRTAEILSTSSRENWRHVPSADNPADCASRGLSPSELKSYSLWLNGPNWLSKSIEFWPTQFKHYGNNDEMSKKPIILTFNCIEQNEWLVGLINQYSSFRKLERVLGYVLRFIGNAKKSKRNRIGGVHLRREELNHILHIICQHEQRRFYQDDILALQSKGFINKSSSLKSLNPFIDSFGIIRVGGRLQNSSVSYTTKHPIILHPKSAITLLILRDLHIDHKHAGPTLLLSLMRQEYWVPNGKQRAKEVIQKCVICTRFKAECQQQLMGNLPSSRIELVRPFIKTGVDYAGPILIHLTKGRGQKTYKAYICLFICLSTKAVHLELVSDLSSEAFLAALKRFTARRGICCELHSDNGSNFVGADRKLKEEFAKIIKGSNYISDYLSRCRISWNFIPPNSPHFGGLWEAAIKSAKFHIKRVVGKTILTLEEMNTLLAEIEGILNSRPLCSFNNDDLDPLTPAHFLIGHPLTKIPEMDVTHLKPSYLTRWQMVQQLSQHFWRRWYLEYLTSLQPRSKWRQRKPPIQINDIVLVQDKNLSPNQWLLGRVTKLHPGSDGLVRVVTLKTQTNEIKRPIHKLCLLPIVQNHSDEA